MPITGEQVTIIYKLLPLTLEQDGSSNISIRRGMLHADGNFECLSQITYNISAVDTAAVLDSEPTPGLTRRDDLSYAIYLYCVDKGWMSGVIS